MRWVPGWPTIDPALARVLRFNAAALATATGVLGATYVLGLRHRAVVDDLNSMGVALVWMWVSMPASRRWGERGALVCLTCSTFTFSFGGTWVTPQLVPLTVMLTLVPLLVGYPYLSRRWLRGLMTYAVLYSSALCFLAAWRLGSEGWMAHALVASASMPSVMLVVIYLVAQNHERHQSQQRDLREVHTRLVEVVDATRRGIERDLHDGAQQRLLAMSVTIERARLELRRGEPSEAEQLLGELADDNRIALQELREFARGIYPPLLTERGLVAALQAASRRSAVPVTLRADAFPRPDQDTENAAYFCILEALNNAVHHSGCTAVEITVRAEPELEFVVSDDGHGFDPSAVDRRGLVGIEARMSAVGGQVVVDSSPGRGTRIHGRFAERSHSGARG